MMQAQAPFSPLTPLLPPLIERLLLLITDLASLTAHHLCEVQSAAGVVAMPTFQVYKG